MRLAATEYARFLDMLRSLSPQEWTMSTCNTGWDVRDLAGHVTEMTHMSASLREQVSQMRVAQKRSGGLFIDALTAEQVRRAARYDNGALVERFAALGPKAARGRRRTPSFVRGRTMPERFLVNGPEPEAWTFGYLVDVILTRDTWMHRTDIALATGTPMTLTADHDGVIVADVVQDWASRHGESFALTLGGPAGGTWTSGDGGPSYDLDAVDFCRILSGRGAGEGLLKVQVPF
jgi:uncharacterized protein (TIGR03083 family)